MGNAINSRQAILEHLDDLSPELIQEVFDFIEFLKIKRAEKNNTEYHNLLLQQESLNRIWDRESEDIYDL